MACTRPILSWVVALSLCIPTYAIAEGYDGGSSWDQDHDGSDHDWDHDADHDWDHDGDHDGDHDWDHPYEHPGHECADYGPADASRPQQKLADKFGVSEHGIARLRGKGLGYGEIDHTLTLAERMDGGINRDNVNEILDMRQEQGMGWGQIAKAQGTTLGRAKQEYPTQPVVEPEPEPTPTTEPTSTAQASARQTSTGQPKSLTRSGKSSHAAAGSSGSAKSHGGKGSVSRGGSSNRSVRVATTTSSPGRSGGHAYGRASSGGGSIGKANGKSNGKAKGPK